MSTNALSKPTHRGAGPQAGLTLIEMLVGMIIMSIIATMLVGGWISLQRSYAFTSVTNSTRATARDALDRMESDLRASQPPTSSATTQFYFTPPRTTLASTYLSGSPASPCGPTTCVFYSAYNNYAVADGTGIARIRLTAIWLDTSGSTQQKTLKLTRDTNASGTFDGADRTIILARNVVNTAGSVNRNLFTYYFRNATTGAWTQDTVLANATTDANYHSATNNLVANLRNIQVEIVVDVNLSHTPTFVDLRTTVRPRNASAIF
jgi:prepilin-type N-terminal cleavage/methylation domain-containing protein